MQVNFYATFRTRAGMRTLELDIPPGTTMRQAVDAIFKKIPGLKSDWLDAEGELQNYVYGFVNGTDVATMPDGWQTKLRPDDVLDFLPPVAGG